MIHQSRHLPWRQSDVHQSTAQVVISHAQWCLENYPRLGIDLLKSARFGWAAKGISVTPLDEAPGDRQDTDRLEAERIVGEFYFIGRTLLANSRALDRRVHEKLSAMTGVGAAGNRVDDESARDTQFELLVLCVCLQGGLSAQVDEPDLRVPFGAETIGLAVKRISSTDSRRPRQRIGDAIRQIRRSGIRGLAVLNMDSSTTAMSSPRSCKSTTSRGAEFDDLIRTALKAQQRRSDSECFLGLVVFGIARSVEQDGQVRRSLIDYFCKTVGLADSELEWELALGFWGYIERGMDSLVRVIST